MHEVLLFATSVALSLLSWSIVCRQYCWPSLRHLRLPMPPDQSLLLHGFRFLGLAFIMPGLVSPTLQAGFAAPAAYGDLGAVVLAWAALGSAGARLALWVFNLWGTVDLLLAFFQGLIGVGIAPSTHGVAYFIPTLCVPLLLVTHAYLFSRLLSRAPQSRSRG